MDQKPYLFNISVKANVQYARSNATDDEVVQACIRAGIHDVIVSRQDKYNTLMGENGSAFSGGESQRICLARLFLQKPKIVFIDEGTSALDLRSEAGIQSSLKETFAQETMVFVTHRLSTVRDLDLIVILDKNGRIVEKGIHDELIGKHGQYYELRKLHEGLKPEPRALIDKDI
ncbi:hypothetical protein FJTKL_15303 [Diaporthe vaccinii]|uniref:ABC transporter domain-containing protein n=1 Tax=Diaporthe vaccinii TaxID=105482 RepID=A0ABR4E5F0_9PEZI